MFRRKPRTETTTAVEPRTHALMARFETPEDLLAATERTRDAGYRDFDVYSPFPVEGISEAMGLRRSPLPLVIFAGGLIGALVGFAMQTYATVWAYPLNIGGRPHFSWPAYIPITFEMTILLAAFAGVFGLFFFTRFPQPYHPVFNDEDFRRYGADDGFFLAIEASDPQFRLEETRRFLEQLNPMRVSEIEA